MVKVIRKWYQQSFSNANFPLALELVLMDVMGNKIHATIKKTLIMYKFEKSLVEGSIYSICGFVLVDNIGDYRTTRHHQGLLMFSQGQFVSSSTYAPNQGLLMFNTGDYRTTRHHYNVFPYTFLSPADILSPTNDSNYLVDVIGILTGVGVERDIVTHGKRSKMTVVEIESVVSYVDELTNFLVGGDVNNPVIIVQFAKVKTFQGNISLQNVHEATKILFYPDVPMENVLKTSIAQDIRPIREPELQLQSPTTRIMNKKKMQGMNTFKSVEAAHALIK
ncbi:uncharacterized protein LOC130722871 [Lotus japonicus]|uniref:uncharacterized protein LOC130722871 n=1 Tax=Lotus japonicus TaxID=34305 RepID=UPI00258CFD59|nr:uncharacterized protein LOC130722871 [Lotus japonicus]